MTAPFPFLHHIGVFADDYEACLRFYTAALAPLDVTPGDTNDDGCEYWRSDADTPSLAVGRSAADAPPTRGLHLAFTAADRAAVDAFHAAAVAAGGVSRHEPRRWPEYRAYCAFVTDPNGNNVEAVHKEP